MESGFLHVREITALSQRGQESYTSINRVSFILNQGEFLTVVGESGSGKTQLARIVARIEEPTGGKILLDGVRDIPLSAFWNSVQMLFQDPKTSFNEWLTVERVLRETMRFSAVSADLDLIKESLEWTGLSWDAYKNRVVGGLNGTELQKILIARVRIIRPRFLIVDDISTSVSLSSQTFILDLLHTLIEELGLGVLFITHSIGLAWYCSERVLVMNRGHLVESGKREDIFCRPVHPYTKKMISETPLLDNSW